MQQQLYAYILSQELVNSDGDRVVLTVQIPTLKISKSQQQQLSHDGKLEATKFLFPPPIQKEILLLLGQGK